MNYILIKIITYILSNRRNDVWSQFQCTITLGNHDSQTTPSSTGDDVLISNRK